MEFVPPGGTVLKTIYSITPFPERKLFFNKKRLYLYGRCFIVNKLVAGNGTLL
jgi:hypothetical protein